MVVKSSFGVDKNDEDLKNEEKERKRRTRLENSELSSMQAELIYKAVKEAYDNGQRRFSKMDMIRLAHPKRKRFTREDTDILKKRCNDVIRKLRLYYWGGKHTPVKERQMFHYVRDQEIYWFVPWKAEIEPTTGVDLAGLGVMVISEEYQRKMEGIQKEIKRLEKSIYKRSLKLPREERQELIKKMRSKRLKAINGNNA